MKRSARLMGAVLSFIMLFSLLLTSCGGGDVTTASGGDTPTTTEGKTILETKTPAGTNFGGEKITIVSRNEGDYFDELTVNADEIANIIDQSIFDREVYVEEKIGVEFENDKKNIGTNWATITDLIRDHFRAGVNQYQLAANACYHTMDASIEGCFWALSDIDTVTLDMPWYSQYFIEEATLPSGELYFVTGDATISRIRRVNATFFNKALADQYGDWDFYKMVSDGKWTIDAQHEIVAGVYEDANGSGTPDDGDVYGFSTGSVLGVDPYWSAFSLPIIERVDGQFVDALDDERMVDGLAKAIDIFYNNPGTYVYKHNNNDLYNEYMMREFASDHYLFMTHWLLSVEYEYLTDMENAYGIIPMPKLNEDQDDYYSYTHDLMSVIGIPGTVEEEKLEMIGTALEELSAYSYNYTREAFFEVALKGRYMRDEESRKMLDLIVDNLRIDAGWIYSKNLGGIALVMRDLVKNKNMSWATVHRSKLNIIKNGLDKLNGLK